MPAAVLSIDIYGLLWYYILMRNWFRKYFVPHEGNEHKPHLLRRELIAAVCVIALAGELVLLSGVSYLAPFSRMFGTILASALVDQTNANRTTDNLTPLRFSPVLQAAAQMKANDMAANSYFAHTSPAGITPWHWFDEAGYKYMYAGENLAVNFTDSQDVTNAWMNSPGHRANILNNNFTEIGIATAEGMYKGESAIFVVELFGTPPPAPIVPVAVAASSPPPVSAPVVQPIAMSSPKPAPKSAPKPTPKSAPVAQKPASSAPQQSFVAVQGAETQASAPVTIPVAPQNNLMQNLASAPRTVANEFYLFLALFFAVVLTFNLYMRLHLKHPRLIMNGALVMAVALVCIFVNQYLAIGQVAVF
jgi:Cysteine-rich secretory protein family